MSRSSDTPYRPARNMGWPLPLLLAARYLKSTRREAYVTFLSILAAGGIALGVAALILILAGLAGLQNFLRSDVLARTPHLEIAWPDGTGGTGVDENVLAEEIRGLPGVVEARQLLRGRGWLLYAGSALEVEIIGYEGELPGFFPSPTSAEPGLYVDHVTAARWGLEAGDLVEIVSPRPTLTPFGPQPRVVRERLAGVFRSGRTENRRHRAAVSLPVARKLFGARQSRLEVRGESFEAALPLADRIAPLLPEGAELRTWKDQNRGLFFALKLEKTLMFVAVFLIVPVAAMALVTVLGLLISAKRAEIGMLQTMGARSEALRRAFLLLGTFLGTSGLTLGAAAGLLGAHLLDRYRLLTPPGDVYFIDYIPFLIKPGDLLAVFGATASMIGLTTIYAARRAARTPAVEALRL